MKNLTHLCLAVFILTLTASCRNKCCVAPDTSNFVLAQKNNVEWTATSSASIYQDSLTVIASNSKEEHLGFRIKFVGIGQYTLINKQGFFYNTVGQDVAVSDYKTNGGATSIVNITNYDQPSGTIVGTFSINLSKIYDNPTGTFPNTLAFLSGKFSAVIAK